MAYSVRLLVCLAVCGGSRAQTVSSWFSDAHLGLFEGHVPLQETAPIGSWANASTLSAGSIIVLLALALVPLVTILCALKVCSKNRYEKRAKCLSCFITMFVLLSCLLIAGLALVYISSAELDGEIDELDRKLSGNVDKAIGYLNETERDVNRMLKVDFDEYYQTQLQTKSQYTSIQPNLERLGTVRGTYAQFFNNMANLTHMQQLVYQFNKTRNEFYNRFEKWNQITENSLIIHDKGIMKEIREYLSKVNLDNIPNLHEFCTLLQDLEYANLSDAFRHNLQKYEDNWNSKSNQYKTSIVAIDHELDNVKKNQIENRENFVRSVQSAAKFVQDEGYKQKYLLIDQWRNLLSVHYILLGLSTGFIIVGTIGVILFLFLLNLKHAQQALFSFFIIAAIGQFLLILAIANLFITWNVTSNSLCDQNTENPSDLLKLVEENYNFTDSFNVLKKCKNNQSYIQVFGWPSKWTNHKLNMEIEHQYNYKDFEVLDANQLTSFKTLQQNLAKLQQALPISALDGFIKETQIFRQVYTNNITQLKERLLELEQASENETSIQYTLPGMQTILDKIKKTYGTLNDQIPDAQRTCAEVQKLDFLAISAPIEDILQTVSKHQDNKDRNIAANMTKLAQYYKETAIQLQDQYNEQLASNLTNSVGTCGDLYVAYKDSISDCTVLEPPLFTSCFLLTILLLVHFVLLLVARCAVTEHVETVVLEEEARENLYDVPINLSFNGPKEPETKETRLDSPDSPDSPDAPETPLVGRGAAYATSWVYEDLNHESVPKFNDKPPPYSEREAPNFEPRYSTFRLR